MNQDGKKTEIKPLKDPETGLFVAGNPGGPGRPPGVKNFTTKVKEALSKIADGKDFTYEEALVKTILKKAIVNEDPKMIQLIWNYLDGKPTQKIQASFESKEIDETIETIKEALNGHKKVSTNIQGGGEAVDNNTDPGADNGNNPLQESQEGSSDTPDPIRQEPDCGACLSA